MLTLIATLLTAPIAADSAAIARPVPIDPPVQLSLNNDGNFAPGGLVDVRVRTAEDGYLIVFRIDGDGHIRVLFPLDPGADAFVRGGKEYELRGRGDRGTFQADDRGGNGLVYAALASQSYALAEFSTNGHWDYDALRLPDSSTDAENDLTAIVARMTNRVHFDYDVLGYRVQEISTVAASPGVGGYYPGLYDPFYNPRWRCLGCGWGYPGADLVDGFGYSPFWDPWLYSPWGYNYGYGYGYGGNYWYGGNYPTFVTPARPYRPLPPGTRTRPRPVTVPPPGSNSNGRRTSAPSTSPRGRPAPPPPPASRSGPPSSVGTRARPRPAEFTTTLREATPTGRSVFRQPATTRGNAPSYTPRQEPQSRPVYREPSQVYRAPPQVYRAPPTQSAPRSSAPAARSAPPSAPRSSAPASRPRGGGRP